MGGHSDKGLFEGVLANRSAPGRRKLAQGGSGDPPEPGPSPAASDGSVREELMGQATTGRVKNLVNELYRPGAETGDGGTADAIREQLRTGRPVGGKDHIRKGRERLRQIKRLLSRFPDHPDRVLLERLRDDLEDALGGTR